LLPVAYVFNKATASGSRSPKRRFAVTDAVFTHPYHPTLIGTDTIHHDSVHASCLRLPVVKS